MAATRRGTIAGIVLGAAACTASAAHEGHGAGSNHARFQHGVASGDPAEDGFVIWTRLTETATRVPVRWEVAADPEFRRIVRRGTAMAEQSRDHCVKIIVGRLQPGTTYYYRFSHQAFRSPVGLARTLPSFAGAMPAGLKLAIVSCSNYPAGYFNVYRAIAGRGDVDLVLHLGDYMYEYGAGGYATQWGATVGRAPLPAHETVTLADYRARYAQYRSDPDLQAAHAACPWLVTWDDHETANDAWADGAENHTAESEGLWSARKAAALQAWYEWMPVRDPVPGRAAEAINRRFTWGKLASISMLETRLMGRMEPLDYAKDLQMRDDGTGRQVPDLPGFMARVADPNRQLLGANQTQWLAAGAAADNRAGVKWSILGNQVIMAKVKSPDFKRALPSNVLEGIVAAIPQARPFFELSAFGIPLNIDAWDGYPAAREQVLAMYRNSQSRLLVVTGDSHSAWANHLRDASGALVGAEFGCTSVTSPSIGNLLEQAGVGSEVLGNLVAEANDDVLWNAHARRGYTLLELTPEQSSATFITVDTIYSQSYVAATEARFVTPWAAAPQELARV